MDRRDDREGGNEDLYSENGDDMELRTSMNLAGLSMSSLRSEFSAQFADSDDGEEPEEDDRDSQGRLRLSMIMSTASENGEDQHLNTIPRTTDGNESEYFERSENGENRYEESGEVEPDGSDKVLKVSAEEDAMEASHDDSADEAVPTTSVDRLEPRDDVALDEGEYPDHILQSPQRAGTAQEQSDDGQLRGKVEPEGITGEDYHQLPERPTTSAQSLTDRTNEEIRDAGERGSSGYAQVKPTSSSPVTVDSKEEELRQTSSLDDDQESQGEYSQQCDDVHRDVLVQSCSRDSPTQETEVAGATHVLAAFAPIEVDHSDGVAVSPLPPEPHPTPSYKIRDLFPVVYEKTTIPQKKTSLRATATSKGQERCSSTHPTTRATSSAKIPNSITKEEAVVHRASSQRKEQQRIQSLHKKLEVTQEQLKNATQSIKMHQIADAEKKQLMQRNARIKQQLDALTADLQRTKAENAKLHAENEVYTSKLPQLYAELLQESCQADEKQAQAVQLQLAMAQLKARVHVLQTRNGNLETQNEKLQLELRESRKELRRKTATLLANTEKLSKLEADVSSLKSVHAHEMLHWKTKLVTATQRFELEKAKQDSELRRKNEHQLSEAKAQAASATKKKRELEVTVMKLDDEIKQSKREADSGHRTEATLRNEVAVLKTKLRVLADDQKKQVDWSLTHARRRAQTTRQHPSGRQHEDKLLYPLDLLLLEVGTESDDDDDEDDDTAEQVAPTDRHCKCCALLLASSPSSQQQRERRDSGESGLGFWNCSSSQQGREDLPVVDGSPRAPCQECAKARNEVQHANAEIHRLRIMHANELKVQMAAYNHMLQLGSRDVPPREEQKSLSPRWTPELMIYVDNHVQDVHIWWTFFKFANDTTVTKCTHLLDIVHKHQGEATLPTPTPSASELPPFAPAPTLAPLTCVLVVLCADGGAREQAGAMPHVVAAISSFLDFALPKFWSLPRACEVNLLSLLRRLAACGSLPPPAIVGNADGDGDAIDPFYWASQCSQGLVFTVTNDNLEMAEWLHELCPTVLPYTATIEAAKTGNLSLLQWLADRHSRVPWTPQMMDAGASTGLVEVLQWLHNHPKNAGCNPTKAFGAAVRGGHLDAVKWLYEHYGDLAKSLHRDTLAAIRSGYTDVAKFLLSIPEHSRLPLSTSVLVATRQGNLELVHWLLSTSRSSPTTGVVSFTSSYSMDTAARGGHLHVVQWLHQQQRHSLGKCTQAAMDGAAGYGSLELIQWLHEHRTEGCTSDAIDSAASGGHLEVVQWLHEHRTEGCTTYAMDFAATEGHLAMVQWLHAHRSEGCTTQAMDGAAKNGHLEIVKWLSEHRSEGCTWFAMDHAAGSGHLEIVQWLHANRNEGCTTEAMDGAARHGHLDVVTFLHEHRTEGCTVLALDDAAENGHLDVVKYLHEHRTEGCTVDAMDFAAEHGHLEIVQFLHEHRSEGCTTGAMQLAAVNGHFAVLLFLHTHRSEGCAADTIRFSDTCVAHMEIPQWLSEKYPDAVDVPQITRRDRYMTAVLDHILWQTFADDDAHEGQAQG